MRRDHNLRGIRRSKKISRGCFARSLRRSAPLPERDIFVAPPRIFKPGEEWILKQVLSSNADGYLIRNYDHLKFFASNRRVGDFSLNVANALSAEYFKTKYNLEYVTASYDLNAEQLEGLLRSAPPEWFEITLHQHMPMFHMEHCVFCAFLSEGTDYRNCGRPVTRTRFNSKTALARNILSKPTPAAATPSLIPWHKQARNFLNAFVPSVLAAFVSSS